MNSYKILIVEDEVKHAEFAAAILKKSGYNLFFADGGKKALTLIKKKMQEINSLRNAATRLLCYRARQSETYKKLAGN